jgi:hypothetical protein
MKADSVTSVSLPRIDIKYSSLSSFWLPDRARVQFINYGEIKLNQPFTDRKPMIHYAEMRAQAGLIFEKKWLLQAN